MLNSLMLLPIIIGVNCIPIISNDYVSNVNIDVFNSIYFGDGYYVFYDVNLPSTPANYHGLVTTLGGDATYYNSYSYSQGKLNLLYDLSTLSWTFVNNGSFFTYCVDSFYYQQIGIDSGLEMFLPSDYNFDINIINDFIDVRCDLNFSQDLSTYEVTLDYDLYVVRNLNNDENSIQHLLTDTFTQSFDFLFPLNSINFSLYDELLNAGIFTNLLQFASDGYSSGYSKGYQDGYNDASLQGGVASEIFTGILNVGLLPVNFFLAIFNFEIFGVNLASIVAALISVAITIIVVKVCTGKGGGSSE